MIDLGRWIYSNDIAEWLMNRESLSIEEQIDCTWLSEFSELVKTDKDCIRTMLSDRQPRNGNLDQKRCAYVRELMNRTRQGVQNMLFERGCV